MHTGRPRREVDVRPPPTHRRRGRGEEGRVGARLASRLLTLGCVPIQASSGAHVWGVAPPARTGPGPRPLQPGVGSESLRSSMPPAQRPWCPAKPARAASEPSAPQFRFPPRTLGGECRPRPLSGGGRGRCSHLRARAWEPPIPRPLFLFVFFPNLGRL